MGCHFERVLCAAVTHTACPVAHLPLWPEAEKQQLLAAWNDTACDYAFAQNGLHHLFEAQAGQTPDAIAVVSDHVQISYALLNQCANGLAHRLVAQGVTPDTPVGLCVERGVEMVVGLLGILKAGGAYVPLEPGYPQARLSAILGEVKAPVVLTQSHLANCLSDDVGQVACLDGKLPKLATRHEVPVCVLPANLAYVIFTSGSTGKPKGVMISHEAICNRIAWMQEAYGLKQDDRVLQKTPFSFDVSVWEFFWPLTQGACLVMTRPGGHQDSSYLAETLSRESITTLHFVPSMLQVFLEEPCGVTCQSLRRIICSGEALSRDLLDRYESVSDVPLFNLYGPTEASVDVTAWPCLKPQTHRTVPIGRPIANMKTYVLSPHEELVPVGANGELHLGGIGLARGYFGRPDLTASVFVPNAFSRQGGRRLYKTGDRVRIDAEGVIEFLGRLDLQVKVRGLRIELGDIRAAIEKHEAVREALVVVSEGIASGQPIVDYDALTDEGALTNYRRLLKRTASGSDSPSLRRLVAYVVYQQGAALTAREIRSFLQEHLPDYMVPSLFVTMDRFPLNPNGKIDRKALPVPEAGDRWHLDTYVAPRNAVEETLAGIWADVLGVGKVGVNDNFFELGGDSILSIKIKAQSKSKGLEFSLDQMLRYQTIRELSTRLTMADPNAPASPKVEAFDLISESDSCRLPKDVEDAFPLARVQAGLIYHSQLEPNTPMYQDIFIYSVRAQFDRRVFRKTVQNLLDRHANLRTSFDLGRYSEPLQLVHKVATASVRVEDLRGLPSASIHTAQDSLIEEEKGKAFDWTRPPLIRFSVHRLTDETFDIVLSFHDSIFDGWSKASLLTELLATYGALINNQSPDIGPPPPVPYRDFVAIERETIASEECEAYWRELLKDVDISTLPEWSAQNQTPCASRIRSLSIPISAQMSDGLKGLALRASVPVKNVLLTAHLKVISLLSGKRDILTGVETNGRPEEIDSERTLGIHINTVPFRLKMAEGS